MKKLVAFLILIAHLNFSMFIPQVDEIDQFDARGSQQDDINSLYEFIDQVVLGNYDDTPEDEDDDQARFFHLAKIDDYSFTQNVVPIKTPELSRRSKSTYPEFITAKLPSIFFEIQSPPPEA